MELAKALILMGCAIGAGIAMISGFGPASAKATLPVRQSRLCPVSRK